MNSLAFLGNYTFFKNVDNVFLRDVDKLINKVLPILMTDNEEITYEGIRIICNLSNTSPGRISLSKDLNFKLLLVLLEHLDRDVVFYTTCTILNIIGEYFPKSLELLQLLQKTRKDWREDEEIVRLIGVLEKESLSKFHK